MLAWKEPAQKGKKNKNDEEFAEALPEISLTLICREWSLQITFVANYADYAFQIEDIQTFSNDCEYIYIYIRLIHIQQIIYRNTCVYIFPVRHNPKRPRRSRKDRKLLRPNSIKMHYLITSFVEPRADKHFK